MKHRKVVSKYLNSLRLLNKDEYISKRYVLQVLKDISKTLISQKLLDRTIKNDLNLYTFLPCIELRKVDKVKCPIVEFKRCDVLMKSVKPIPEPIFSRLGGSVGYVESVDGTFDFKLIDKSQYKRNRQRRYSMDDLVYLYIGEDFHLYVIDKEIQSLNISLITMDTDEDDCSSCKEDDCKSGWDAEFICPDKLLSTVFGMATQELAQTYKSIVPDQNPNLTEKG